VAAGRPKKTRVPGSGDKLRRGFEVLGRTWGKNKTAANHVFQDERWSQCGLPKSINTVQEDIRLGIPLDRLAGYAAFLDISIDMLHDAAVSSHAPRFDEALFAAREVLASPDLPIFKYYAKQFRAHFQEFNNSMYVQSLFEVLRGVYHMETVFPPAREIHQSDILVHTAERYALRAECRLPFQGGDIRYDVVIYRWGSNLHISYHSRDMRMLGRLMAEDPLRHYALAHRRPFYLDLVGVGDALSGPRTCCCMRCRVERLEGDDTDPRRAFDKACRQTRKRPVILPTDPDHAAHMARLSRPDSPP